MQSTLTQHYLNEAFKPNESAYYEGKTVWQSPSNIALVKYWGKHGNQLPNNPSISLTLNNARTITQILYKSNKNKCMSIEFLFEGQQQTQFGEKIGRFLQSILPYFPFLEGLHLSIESKNTFPHSSGIASSASSMSALVMCLLDIEKQISPHESTPEEWFQKASYFSRIASGSASRSVFPYASLWGKSDAIAGSSNEFAIPLGDQLHPVFKTYRDSILIISAESKSVSSRAGHSLMENNPFAPMRYDLAALNTIRLLQALKSGDLDTFIEITEAEALQLHALMMTSNPSFILLKPNTIGAIEAIKAFRSQTQIPLCFTLDAGPNIHLLYPNAFASQVNDFIEAELLSYCDQGRWIDDHLGLGATIYH